MSYKQTILDNAWFGFNQVDYGLLHFQLATSVVTLIILFVLIFIMNKLLFQPVFRTINNRQKIVEGSKSNVASANVEIAKLSQEYEDQLKAARVEVSDTYSAARQEAQKQRDELLQQVRQEGESELEKGKTALSEEVDKVKAELGTLVQDLSGITSTQLLS